MTIVLEIDTDVEEATMSAGMSHGWIVILEVLLAQLSREEVLGCIALAALVIATITVSAAVKRKRPRMFDLWLIVAFTLSMLVMMLAYSGAVIMVGTHRSIESMQLATTLG